MVVTITYRPSDLKAMEKLKELKRKLGVPSDPKKWSNQDIIKVDRYFRSIGWNMAMNGCNPEVFFWNRDPVTNKALCMLYNELMIARNEASIRSAQSDLKEFGRIYEPLYRKTLSTANTRIKRLQGWNAVVKDEVEKNTGIRTVPVPQPKPSVVMKPVTPKSLPMPAPKSSVVPTKVHVMVEQSQPEQKSIFSSKWIIALAVLAGLYIVLRRRR